MRRFWEGESFILYYRLLTEATNAENELYGDARLLEAARKLLWTLRPTNDLRVKANVDHCSGAPQF